MQEAVRCLVEAKADESWNQICAKTGGTGDYPFSHNHGSGKWLYLKGNDYWRDPFLISMIMGGRVGRVFFFKKR